MHTHARIFQIAPVARNPDHIRFTPYKAFGSERWPLSFCSSPRCCGTETSNEERPPPPGPSTPKVLHLLRSPTHPVACTAQVVRPAPIRSSSPRCSPRQSLQCRRQVSCPFPGEKYGTPRHPNLLSTPQVRASDLFDLTLNELSGFAAQAPDPVLQHVRRQTDGIHG